MRHSRQCSKPLERDEHEIFTAITIGNSVITKETTVTQRKSALSATLSVVAFPAEVGQS